MLVGIVLRGQQQGCGAVDDARRIAGVVKMLDLEVGIFLVDLAAIGGALLVERMIGHRDEGWLEAGEAFGGRVGAREFVLGQHDAALVVLHRDQAPVEAAFGDRDRGAALAFQPERIQGFARNSLHRGDGVAADALVRLRMHLRQALVAGAHAERRLAGGHVLGGHRSGERHHLGAAGDHDVFHAAHDLRGGKVHRGDAAAAEAVQRGAGGLDVVAGVERRHAAEVAALLAALGRGRPDHVVDIRGIEMVALGDGAQDGRGEVLRVMLGQRALADLADATGRANGVDDIGLGHGVLPTCF